SLVDQSLLFGVDQTGAPPFAAPGSGRLVSPRFRMLETIREYGWDSLVTCGEDATLRDAHAAWCLALAEEAWRHFFSANEPAWMDRLEADYGNLQAALDWLAERGRAAAGLRLAGALGWFWHSRGPVAEGRRWLDQLLARADGVAPAVRAQALTAAGLLAWSQYDYAPAEASLREAQAIWRTLEDGNGLLRALIFETMIAWGRGDLVRRVALSEEAVTLARTLGDPVWIAQAAVNLGHTRSLQGDAAGAVPLLDEGIALHRTVGYERGIGWALEIRGNVALLQGDAALAEHRYREGLALAWRHGGIASAAHSLPRLAAAVAAGGRPAEAARLLGATAAMREALGGTPAGPLDVDYTRAVETVRAVLDAEEFSSAWLAGKRLTPAQAVAEASAASPPRLPAAGEGLSPREVEVLRLLAAGRSDREIAAALFISPHTASRHVHNLLGKLGVESRAAAAAYAVRHGLA
ncbi:MAG TPA: LuxR C-terminal-related transcriptional regulator, partial [Thermomicrobiales bacterium]|nr:LuxR C-terminal-related transcriptional regulator [Thermomicrobiales bacterium]